MKKTIINILMIKLKIPFDSKNLSKFKINNANIFITSSKLFCETYFNKLLDNKIILYIMSKSKLEKNNRNFKISSNSNNIELDSFSILLLVDQLETL